MAEFAAIICAQMEIAVSYSPRKRGYIYYCDLCKNLPRVEEEERRIPGYKKI